MLLSLLGAAYFEAQVFFHVLFVSIAFCGLAQPVRGLTLGDLLDKPWSQVGVFPSPSSPVLR